MRATLSLIALLGALLLLPQRLLAGPEDVFQPVDRIFLKGSSQPLEGTIIEETRDGVRFRPNGYSAPYVISPGDIERIERAETLEHAYESRASRLLADDAEGHLGLARFCLRYGLDKPAEREAFLAMKAAPGNVEIYRLLSLALRARYSKTSPATHGELRDRELEVYERAEAAGALPADLRLEKARLLRECGDVQGAFAEFEKLGGLLGIPSATTLSPTGTGAVAGLGPDVVLDDAVGSDPGFRRTVGLELGDLALSLGRPSEAEHAFNAVAERYPEEARAFLGRGLAAFGRGDFAAADRDLAIAASASAVPADPLIARAACALYRGDARLADELMERAATLGTLSGDGATCGAFAAALRGRVSAARARIGAVAPTSSRPSPREGELLLARGFVEEVAGDRASALAFYERAAVADARIAGLAHLARATALEAKGERGAAEVALQQAARAGCDFGEVASALARLRREAGDFATAIRFARYVVDRRPSDADALYALGLSYLGANEVDEAEAHFDAALAIDPDHALACCGKGAVLYGRGDFKSAAEQFHHALDVDPGNAYAGLALRQLEEARSRRLWRDDFQRPDSKDVRNRWLEEERFGLEAAVRRNHLVISGRQANEDMGRTQIVREIEGQRFAEFRALLDMGHMVGARGGIRLVCRDAEVAFFRNPDGDVAYAVRTVGRWSDAKTCGSWPVTAPVCDMWIAVGGPARDELVFGLGGHELAHEKLPVFGRSVGFSCALYCQAPLGESVELSCSEVRLLVVREHSEEKSTGY